MVAAMTLRAAAQKLNVGAATEQRRSEQGAWEQGGWAPGGSGRASAPYGG